MKRGSSFSFLRWLSLFFIFAAVLLTVIQLVQYSRIRNTFPPGMLIADVPVGGLDPQAAADRLVQAYSFPVELHYGEGVIQIKPSVIGFDLDLQSMLAAADLQRVDQPFWSAYWDFLWNRMPSSENIPLRADISEDRLRAFLSEEVAARYDQAPSAALPVPGSVNFSSGNSGTTLNLDRAVILIEDALRSPSARVVNLPIKKITPNRPSFQNLEILLKQTIDISGYDGASEIYLLDLQTNKELSFAYQQRETIKPDVAFTAASTMKIPIMVSVFRRENEPTPQDVIDQMTLMIERSENDPADRLMEQVLDRALGPLQVTEDLRALGLQNTFLAGYFYPGAPLLQEFKTPANQREDIFTDPDRYNQTTPSDMGMLLTDIYQCSETGGGTFAAVWPGQISQNECREMIDLLSHNDIPVLIQGGLPEGTRIAHKHGWITETDGLQHMAGDSAIVYTPGGNFILVIFMHHPTQLVFDPANNLVIQLTQAVYNYFNMQGQ